MKKQTVIFGAIFLFAGLFATTSTAQIVVDGSAGAQTNSGGGLGKGINYMVKSILGEETAAPEPAMQAKTMMQADTAATARMAPEAPQAATMMFSVAAEGMVGAEPMTNEDLHAHIQELLQADSRLQVVDTAETHVRLTYATPVSVLGLVTLNARITVGAYASGETTVSYPWYAFAAPRLGSDFRLQVRESVEQLIPDGEFTLEQQQVLIDEIYITLASEFGSHGSAGL